MGKMFQRRSGEKYPQFQQRCAASLKAMGRNWPRVFMTEKPNETVIAVELTDKPKPKRKSRAKPRVAEVRAAKALAAAAKPKRVRKPKTVETSSAIAV